MIRARCPVCHRVERWHGEAASLEIEVVVPGGDRRPARHAALSTWEVLKRSRSGDLGPVVGACAACGQPMVCESGAWPAVQRWVIETPAGSLEVGDRFTGPQGVMTEEDAGRWLETQVRSRWTAGGVALQMFGSGMLLMFLFPLLLWLLGAIYAFFFIYVGLASMR